MTSLHPARPGGRGAYGCPSLVATLQVSPLAAHLPAPSDLPYLVPHVTCRLLNCLMCFSLLNRPWQVQHPPITRGSNTQGF